MVVSDLHFEGIAAFPAKTDPPLIVDPDTVLTLPIPRQLLEAITRWYPQSSQRISSVENQELLQCGPVNVLRERFRAFATEHLHGLWIFEAPNHNTRLMRRVNTVKRYVPSDPNGPSSAAGTRRQQRLAGEGRNGRAGGGRPIVRSLMVVGRDGLWPSATRRG